MKTKSFQLEETVPGSFFFQGLAGGMLGGFIFVLLIALWVLEHPHPDRVIVITPVFMIMGAIFGVVKAAFLWGAYRVTGLQIRVLTRVAATAISTGLVCWGLHYMAGPNNEEFALGMGIAWLTTLPVALVVGSRVKPWEFFTFGSIATSDGNRVGSRSVPATLGTLILRFLSIYAAIVWILIFVCQRHVARPYFPTELLFSVALLYYLVSTYLTFRSPRKPVLLAIAILLNLPTAFLFLISYEINFNHESWGEDIPWMVNMSGMFLIAWLIFLVARLCVGLRTPTRTVPVRPPVVFYPHKESDHHCLGSRFSEWH